jgi:Skp family chaperone for outer membrane proteins
MNDDIQDPPVKRKRKYTWQAWKSKKEREVRRRARRQAEREAQSIGDLSAAIVKRIAEQNGFDL